MIISAIQTLTFILVGNWILEIHGLTLTYWLILFSTAAFANILGLNISSTFDSVVTIYITIPFILVPQLLFSGVIVDFTKLNKNFTSYKNVPIIGDIMTSRWGYEALAVAQFKNNKYEKHYFEVDMEKSKNNYKLSYLVPELEKYANTCIENIGENKNVEQTERYFKVLKNEIKKLNSTTNIQFNDFRSLSTKKFDKTVHESLLNYCNKLTHSYNAKQYKLNLKYDSVSHHLIKVLGSNEAVYQLKIANHKKH